LSSTRLIDLFNQKQFLAVFLFIVIVKAVLLVTLGPAIMPDSDSYIRIGQALLDDPSLWRHVEWTQVYSPEKLFRPYGYPLLIAGAKLVSESGFQWIMIAAQTVVSLAVLLYVARFARCFIENERLFLVLVTLSALSGSMLFDLTILTDSFYSSLFIFVFIAICAQIAGYAQPRFGFSVLLGLAWAVSITLRDVGLMHSFLPLVGLILMGLGRRLGWGRTLAHAMLFLLPVAVLYFGVTHWNQYRTGHAFFSITGGINWLWPSVNMLDRGLADPFSCQDAICRMAQTIEVEKGMSGVFAIAAAIEAQTPLDPIEFGHLTLSHFLGTVSSHPLAYVASVFGNVQFGRLADLVFNPVYNLNELARLHSDVGSRIVPGTREMWGAVRGGSFGLAVPLLIVSLLTVLSFCCLAAAVVGPPVRFVKRWGQGDAKAIAALYLWGVVAVFIGSYALIHMEMRHALPCVPLILMAFGFSVETWRAGRRQSLPERA